MNIFKTIFNKQKEQIKTIPAIHRIGSYHWRRITSELPGIDQVMELKDSCKDYRETKVLHSPVIRIGNTQLQIETQINCLFNPYHGLSVSNGLKTETTCSPNMSDIKNAFFETYYTIKQGFEPLRE